MPPPALIQIEGSGNQVGLERHGEQMLNQLGFKRCRVRFHDMVARIEVKSSEEFQKLLDPEIRDEIIRCFREMGFIYTAVDLQDQQRKEKEP